MQGGMIKVKEDHF